MANNKMLIDASHREETRVVVVRGNRIEEFDFEAQERKQLRGNIYLAKVTRVEPSLQAAFVDYGGNRHGFLAFSEIHPDYYQIPAADRQALLDEEANSAAQDAEAEEIEENRKADETEVSEEKPEADTNESDASEASPEKSDDESAGDEYAEPKKNRRTRRPRKAKGAKSDEETETANADDGSEFVSAETSLDDDDGGSTMAAMVETDSISEPAPEDESGSEEEVSDEQVEEKPKKRTRRKTTRKKATKKDADEKAEEAASSDEEEINASDDEEKPKKRRTRRTRKKKSDDEALEENTSEAKSSDEGEAASSDESVKEEAANAKPKSKRRGSRKKAKKEAVETDENGEPIEAVGQEDALEEVPTRKRLTRQYKIQEVIRRRQVLLVQVVKEERGNKGAALTTYLSLAGRYSVLMPNTARGGGISRKITNSADRKRLKEVASQLDVPKGMGVILRTAGATRTTDEIKRDFEYLMRLWENVRNLTLESSAPYLVYEEGSLIKRSIRDLYHKDIGEIIVSGDEGFKEAKDFMNMMMPTHTKNVKQHRGEQSILSRNGVDAQLEKMLSPQVTLKSGGYLVINQTEALVAIDVNSGKSTREHSVEATAVQTNLEAAEEVARQLRLRDLAGLVVIDFIDMEEKRNNRAVERKLKDCLKHDRARIQVGHISHFGLMEMSRQRIRASVLESTMEPCPHCDGIGHVRSQSSFAIQIIRALEVHLNNNSRNDVSVKVSAANALYVLNHKRRALSELEERFGVAIQIIADAALEGQNYNLEKGPAANKSAKPSAVVNPMNGDNSDDTDENEKPNKRRGRRRGGRNKGKNQDQDEANKEEIVKEENAVDEKTSDVADNSDDQKEEKPRKRKRTSRKAKSEEDADEVKSEEQRDADTGEADSETATGRKRTGRPGKKAKSEKEPPKEEAAEKIEKPSKAKAADKEDAEEQASEKPKRRNTRRVKAEKTESDEASESAPEKEKKKSWWSGGGFFS